MTSRRILMAAAVALLLLPAALAHSPPTLPAGMPALPGLDTGFANGEPAGVPARFGTAGPGFAGGTTESGYVLNFTCPQPPVLTRNVPCPWRIVDVDDILGNPGFAIDPLFPGRMAFASLHGSAGDGPSKLSRAQQTHTVFTTAAYGMEWRDNPYTPPSPPFQRGRSVNGEDTHALMDESGNLYVASLYAHRSANDDNVNWSYTIANWKFDPTLDVLTFAVPNEVFNTRIPGAAIKGMWLVHLPELRQVALLWHEVSQSNVSAEVGGRNLTSILTGALSPTDPVSPWTMLPDKVVAGPCANVTNPVAHRGKIYFGCTAGVNYSLVSGVGVGDVMLHRIDPKVGTLAVVSKAPLRIPDLHLSVTPEGRMALVGVEVTGNHSVRAQVATSTLGEGWSRARDFGEDLRNASLPVTDARFTASLYRSGTNTIHLVYAERGMPYEDLPQENQTEDAYYDFPALWRKSLVVIDPLGTVLVNWDLDLGDKGEVFRFANSPGDEDIFGDTRDTLIDVDGREFLAFNDYGVISILELLEDDQRQETMGQLQAPPLPEPVPVPQAGVPAASIANVSVGVAAGAAAAFAARRAAAVRAGGRDDE